MTGPGEFDGVNEAVASEWVSETPPRERVREVIAYTYTPVPAASIADSARTSTNAARKHLDVLAESGFVTVETDGDRVYRRSSQSLVVEQATGILDDVSRGELTARVSQMRERVEELRATHDVESFDDITDREDIDDDVIREWQTTRRNLAFANAALSIARAERVIDDTRRG